MDVADSEELVIAFIDGFELDPGLVDTSNARIAPNRLARLLSVESNPKPNRAWAAGITYISTREGWLYLSVNLDLASRGGLGASHATRPGARARRFPDGPAPSRSACRFAWDVASFQSRVQYACGVSTTARRSLLHAEHEPRGRLLRQRCCEILFATLTKKLLADGLFTTRAQASRELFEFIEIWYNRQHRLRSRVPHASRIRATVTKSQLSQVSTKKRVNFIGGCLANRSLIVV